MMILLAPAGVSKIVKSQIESNSQHGRHATGWSCWCVKDRQITNWKQFTTSYTDGDILNMVCQRSSNHKLKAIHNQVNKRFNRKIGVSKIVKSQIESNSQRALNALSESSVVCQRSSNHKLKAIHNMPLCWLKKNGGVSKIVKSQIESNSQLVIAHFFYQPGCVKDRQITNWKQFTTHVCLFWYRRVVCQRSSNHKLKAIHN